MKVKKAFLRSVSGLMAVCMAVLLSGGISAEDKKSKSIDYKEITDDKEKEQLIVATLKGEEIITPNFNIVCILGHNLSRGTGYETYHNYYSTSPKCREITYAITYCTRSGCNYSVGNQISDFRIPCHG